MFCQMEKGLGWGAVEGALPVVETAKSWSCLKHPSALQGLTGSRAFLVVGAFSQLLESMSDLPNFSHLDPQLPGRKETCPTPFSLNFLP